MIVCGAQESLQRQTPMSGICSTFLSNRVSNKANLCFTYSGKSNKLALKQISSCPGNQSSCPSFCYWSTCIFFCPINTFIALFKWCSWDHHIFSVGVVAMEPWMGSCQALLRPVHFSWTECPSRYWIYTLVPWSAAWPVGVTGQVEDNTTPQLVPFTGKWCQCHCIAPMQLQIIGGLYMTARSPQEESAWCQNVCCTHSGCEDIRKVQSGEEEGLKKRGC